MTNSKKVEIQLVARATEELQKNVQNELTVKDPPKGEDSEAIKRATSSVIESV